MATTTGTISITSDVSSSFALNISKTMTMTKAGVTTGLEETTGLRTKKFADTTAAIIVEEDELTNDKAHKLYVRNASTDKSNFFYIAYNASAAGATTDQTIGKLYGGDWMLMPYNGNTDITAAANDSDGQILEYMVFADGIVAAKG